MFKSLLPWKHTKTKVMVPEQTMEDEDVLQEQKLIPCNTCGRTFLALPLRKHAPICEKSLSKKRKIFDSLKQRVEGTDLAQFHQKSYLKRQESTLKTTEKSKNPSQWEESHQKLVDTIRSAKGASRDMSPCKRPSQLVTTASSNERCPFCERQFGIKAFDRHVEWCKEHRTRVQKSPANIIMAKERLEARTKYKVPLLNKSKRATIKEKYSNTNINRTESVCSMKSTPPNPPRKVPSIKKPQSVLDLAKKAETPTKIEKKNSVTALDEAKKSKEQNKSNASTPYDPFVLAERQFMELLECDDFKPFTSTFAHTLRPHTAADTSVKLPAKKSTKSAQTTNKKRASVIDPPVCFQDPGEDDFEILENLINHQFNNETGDFYLDLNKQNKDDFNVILNQRKYSDDTSSIDSSLINENDNLSIPEHFKLDYSTEDTDTTIQNENVDLYSLQCDKKIEPQTNKKGKVKKSFKTKTKSNSSFGSGDASQVKERTKNTFPVSKQRDSFTKTKVKSPEKVLESNEPEDLTVKPEDLFAVDDKMYAEYKIYEEMYLKEKEHTGNSKKQRAKNSLTSYGIEIANEEQVHRKNKVSDDSAYGSLNRNTPKTAKLSPLQRKRIDSASSSGSENLVHSPVLNNPQRMSKFCHECGNKYPLTTAKFCVECGVKRLLL